MASGYYFKIHYGLFEGETWKDVPLRKLRGAPLSVLLAIASHIGKDGKCWPGIKRLCLYTDYSEAQVKRAIRFLAKMGYITVTPRYREDEDAMIRTSNLYDVSKFFSVGKKGGVISEPTVGS